MRYEEYIETNTPWCEKHPAHWQIVKFKSLFSLGKGLNITKADLIEKGVPVISYGQVHAKYNSGVGLNSSLFRYVDKAYANSNNQSLVHENDFIFADTSEDREGCGNCVFVDSDLMLFAGYHSIIARNKGAENNKYVAYQFLTDMWRHQIRSNVDGVKVFSVTKAILNKSSILLPPREEQDQIVRYLDWKVSCINKLIHGYQRQIKLLEERKRTFAFNAVTKGIMTGVRTAESPLYWLESIPAHWNTNSISQLFTEVKNKNSGLQENNLLSLSYGSIKRRNINATEGLLPSSFEGYNIIEKNDIVLRLTDLQNDHKSLRTGIATERGIITSAYLTIRNKSNNNPEFLHLFLHAFDLAKGFYNVGASGVRQSLNWDTVKMLKVLIPPVSEQVQIVKAIKEEYAKIDASIPVFEKQIALLKEYRTRLISDVVTGQMDVRNIEIPEFEAEVDFEADAGNETDEDDDTMNEEATTDE